MEITKKISRGEDSELITIQVANDNHEHCLIDCVFMKYRQGKPYCRQFKGDLTEIDIGQFYRSARCNICKLIFGV
jgi:hypothetical protein